MQRNDSVEVYYKISDDVIKAYKQELIKEFREELENPYCSKTDIGACLYQDDIERIINNCNMK